MFILLSLFTFHSFLWLQENLGEHQIGNKTWIKLGSADKKQGFSPNIEKAFMIYNFTIMQSLLVLEYNFCHYALELEAIIIKF